MSDTPPPLTAREIREQFLVALEETTDGQMNYLDFYRWLRQRGMRPKGGNPKECQRSIYNALLANTFIKVSPGVFRPRGSE